MQAIETAEQRFVSFLAQKKKYLLQQDALEKESHNHQIVRSTSLKDQQSPVTVSMGSYTKGSKMNLTKKTQKDPKGTFRVFFYRPLPSYLNSAKTLLGT